MYAHELCNLISACLLCAYMWFVFKSANLGQVKQVELHHLKSHRRVGVTDIHSKPCKKKKKKNPGMHEHSFGKAVKVSVWVHALQACQPVAAPGTISQVSTLDL